MSETYYLALELEKHIIKYPWSEEIISNFPEEFKEELRHPEQPTAVGFRDDVGWFILGCGQGPFIIYKQK